MKTMKMKCRITLLLPLMICVTLSVAYGQNVKVTPVGQRTGDFCATDRALIFEDPTGVRILYDPGNTSTGPTDPRLRDVHVILISHAHADQLGAARLNQDPNAPTALCIGGPTAASPDRMVDEIAAAKNSAVIGGGPLVSFIGSRIAAQAGTPNTAGCPSAGLGNEMTVPRTAPCTGGVGFSAKRTVRHVSASQGV